MAALTERRCWQLQKTKINNKIHIYIETDDHVEFFAKTNALLTPLSAASSQLSATSSSMFHFDHTHSVGKLALLRRLRPSSRCSTACDITRGFPRSFTLLPYNWVIPQGQKNISLPCCHSCFTVKQAAQPNEKTLHMKMFSMRFYFERMYNIYFLQNFQLFFFVFFYHIYSYSFNLRPSIGVNCTYLLIVTFILAFSPYKHVN